MKNKVLAFNQPIVDSNCGPTWVHSLREWTREGPLLQIGPSDHRRSSGPFVARSQLVRWRLGSEVVPGLLPPASEATREEPLLQIENLRFACANRGFAFPSESSNKFGFLQKKLNPRRSAWVFCLMWSHLGSNQGPSDYESDALTN